GHQSEHHPQSLDPESPIPNPQSWIANPGSPIPNPPSRIPDRGILDSRSGIPDWRLGIRDPRPALRSVPAYHRIGPFDWRGAAIAWILASMRTILIVALLAQAQQPPWEPKNLRYFPKDITREALVQRMREFSFALSVRCQ